MKKYFIIKYVASLDYKVDEYKIREVFSLAGTVV
jgi:hypothetical protein